MQRGLLPWKPGRRNLFYATVVKGHPAPSWLAQQQAVLQRTRRLMRASTMCFCRNSRVTRFSMRLRGSAQGPGGGGALVAVWEVRHHFPRLALHCGDPQASKYCSAAGCILHHARRPCCRSCGRQATAKRRAAGRTLGIAGAAPPRLAHYLQVLLAEGRGAAGGAAIRRWRCRAGRGGTGTGLGVAFRAAPMGGAGVRHGKQRVAGRMHPGGRRGRRRAQLPRPSPPPHHPTLTSISSERGLGRGCSLGRRAHSRGAGCGCRRRRRRRGRGSCDRPGTGLHPCLTGRPECGGRQGAAGRGRWVGPRSKATGAAAGPTAVPRCRPCARNRVWPALGVLAGAAEGTPSVRPQARVAPGWEGACSKTGRCKGA